MTVKHVPGPVDYSIYADGFLFSLAVGESLVACQWAGSPREGQWEILGSDVAKGVESSTRQGLGLEKSTLVCFVLFFF